MSLFAKTILTEQWDRWEPTSTYGVNRLTCF